MYDTSGQPILMSWSEVVDVNSHDGTDKVAGVFWFEGARASALGVFADRRRGREIFGHQSFEQAPEIDTVAG